MKEAEFTEKEIKQRRDAAIKRALNTPPKPHKAKKKIRKKKAK